MIMMNNNQSEKEKERTNSLIDNIIRDFQNFIIRVQICLKLFYCRTINYACFTNEKDELMNLITTLFFKTGRIYKVTFDLQKIKLSNEVDDMINKYRQLYNITPQQLGIKKQFCLNEETLSLQESILEKEEKRIDENMKKDKEDKNRISDLNDKGVGVLYLNDDDPLDKKKIQDLLKKIKEMKKIFPKNFNYNSNNIKVDIDFDHDDNNLLPESYMNKPTYVSEDNSILPKGRENSCIETDFPMVNLQSRITCNPNIINTKEISTNIFYDNDNNARELQNYNNENQIIRGCEEDGRKTVSPLKYIKIFNQVKFIKDPSNKTNIRYPYETAIQLLKQIEKYKAPFEKMLIFASLGNEITNCVNDFWKEMDDYVKNDMLGVEAEQLMTIFIFIIAKAQINDIVVHYVGNPRTNAQQNRDFYNQQDSDVCSHFVIGLEGEIIMCVPLTEKSASSNDRNRDTISIRRQSARAAKMRRRKSFNLSTDHVIRHYEVTGKECPMYYVRNPEKWDQFKEDLKAAEEAADEE